MGINKKGLLVKILFFDFVIKRLILEKMLVFLLNKERLQEECLL